MKMVRKMCMLALLVLCFAGMMTAMAGSEKVDVNTAGVEELMRIKGIGKAIAERIVAERTANGPFTSVEDLQRVKGIGSKSLDKIREFIMVSSQEEKSPS